MKYSKDNPSPFADIADIVYEKLHEKQGFDTQCKGYVTEIVNNAIAFVVYRLTKDNENEAELEQKIRDIDSGLIAFIALFVSQLEYFSRGEEDGPLYDLLEKYSEDPEDHNDGGLPS